MAKIPYKVQKLINIEAMASYKDEQEKKEHFERYNNCLLYTSPSPRDS